MSISVTQIVLHQLIKNTQEDGICKLETQLRENLLTVTPELEQMMLRLHQSYQNKAKGYGVFQNTSKFAQFLNRFQEHEVDFLTFSHQSTALLASELENILFLVVAP